MGFSYRRPQFPSAYASSSLSQSPPTFGGPSAVSPAAMPYGSASGTPSPAAKTGHGVQPLPGFLGSPLPQPVSTNRDQNFQRSVNLERATTANKAIAFAANSPLPMSPAPTPAIEPGAPTPPAAGDNSVVDAISPMASPSPVATAPASTSPAMEYNGAFGHGPQAQKQAEAARAAYIAGQATVSNAQDYGYGPNMLEDSTLRSDYNDRENAAVNAGPDPMTAAKVAKLEADTAKSAAYTRDVLPTVVDKNTATAQNLKSIGPVNVAKGKSQADVNKARADAIPKGTDTDANREKRLAGQANPAQTRAAFANANDVVTMARKEHDLAAKDVRDIETRLGGLPQANTPIIARERESLQAALAQKREALQQAEMKYQQAITGAAQQRKAAATPALQGGPIGRGVGVESRYQHKIIGAAPTLQGGPTPQAAATPITIDQAKGILQEAGGDKEKARQIALSRGLSLQ